MTDRVAPDRGVEACCHDQFEWYDHDVHECPACGVARSTDTWSRVAEIMASLAPVFTAIGVNVARVGRALADWEQANGRPRKKYRARRRHAGLTRTGRPR